MNRKALIIVAALLLIALLFAGFLLMRSGRGDGEAGQERLNTLKLVRQYMDRQEYDRSLSLLEKLLLADPDDEEARLLLDEILERKKSQESNAREQELAALKNQQEQLSDSLRELGSSIQESRTSAPPQAEKVPEDASAKERERIKKINALLAEGVEKLNRKDYRGANNSFNEVLELDPDTGQAYAYLGQSYYEEDPGSQSNVQKAVEASKQALSKDPGLWII